ncbi:MAG: ferritin [Planctomycetes bacterium DG_23]|nr:MAG: ferritin [Planctomycetes bacterium DG_23]
MIGKKMEVALNEQINAELYSSYLYLSMSAYLESLNLRGFAHWMRVQAREEEGHALKIYDHIIERGGRVTLGAVEAPPTEWDSPLAVFEQVASHEQKVTGLINELVDLATSENDHATRSFLQWFVDEQVEEEDSANQVLEKFRLVAAAPGGLFMIDRELAERK